jgi:hypothetical protein
MTFIKYWINQARLVVELFRLGRKIYKKSPAEFVAVMGKCKDHYENERKQNEN